MNHRDRKRMSPSSPAIVCAAGLIGLLFAVSQAPRTNAQETAGEQVGLVQMQEQLFSLLNTERRVQELPELTFDARLAEAARQHCEKMAAEKSLSHDFPGYDRLDLRLSAAGLYFSADGENIAFSHTYVVRFVHQALLTSPGHRQNILNGRFTHVGIGVVQVEDGYYITQVFAHLFTVRPPADVARDLTAKLDQRVSAGAGQPLIFLDWLADIPQRAAEDSLKSLPVRRPEGSLGKCILMNISFFETKEAAAALEKEILKDKTGGITLAVVFGRNEKYPGGVYFVSALLFPSDTLFAFGEQELLQRLFTNINSLRKDNGLAPLRLSQTLSEDAQAVAKAYYQRPEGPTTSTTHALVIAFQSEGLHLSLPPNVGQKMVALAGQAPIGISVYYPMQHRLPGNYFIVVLIAE